MKLVNIVECKDELNRREPQLMMLEVKKHLNMQGIKFDRMLYECNSCQAYIWKKEEVLQNGVA